MKVFSQSLKNNRVVFAWFLVFVLFLLFTPTPNPGKGERMLTTVWKYWNSGEGKILVAALGATLSTALPVSIAILFLSLCGAGLSYFKPIISPYITVFMGLSLLPTVYLVFLMKTLSGSIPTDNRLFLVSALVFSNLILFFFYMDFRKELYEEFEKECHTFSRMLGQNNLLRSSARKICLILLERFRPLFILVFSSTIFAEHKLNVAGGIYTLLYKTTTSIAGRPDIFYGQVLFILLFVVVFLLVYDLLTTFIKSKYY